MTNVSIHISTYMSVQLIMHEAPVCTSPIPRLVLKYCVKSMQLGNPKPGHVAHTPFIPTPAMHNVMNNVMLSSSSDRHIKHTHRNTAVKIQNNPANNLLLYMYSCQHFAYIPLQCYNTGCQIIHVCSLGVSTLNV